MVAVLTADDIPGQNKIGHLKHDQYTLIPVGGLTHYLGDAIALGLLLLQRYTGVVKLDPTTYYVETAPVEINVPIIIALNVVTLVVSVFVLIAPSYFVSHIHPAKSMRYE